MKDSKTLAYINMYALLGALENLCDLDAEAKNYASVEKPVSICFKVNDGPVGTLNFADGKCKMTKGKDQCNVLIPIGSVEKFNKVIDGTATPIPVKGFSKISFLTGNFTKLTDILAKTLRATPEQLANPEFLEKSTIIMFYMIAEAVAAIANNDKIGKISAKRVPDGEISMEITDKAYATITVKDHKFTVTKSKSTNPRAYMIFADIETARKMFDGKEDTMSFLGQQKLVLKGYVPMIDNLNRLLSRVALYLA